MPVPALLAAPSIAKGLGSGGLSTSSSATSAARQTVGANFSSGDFIVGGDKANTSPLQVVAMIAFGLIAGRLFYGRPKIRHKKK